jgi:hypothetical protein
MNPQIMDWVESQIINGVSQVQIAATLGIGASTLYDWINKTPDEAARFARAREASAEAWLDKGATVLEAALLDRRYDSGAARALEQAYARRAAIRNPQYREKRDNTLSAPDGGPVGVRFDAITFTVVDPKRDATGD